ncbi:MAG: hypothetical protein A2Y78_08550 [Acidobacteria bacterium RBG_13_68_16]|nr:MAG: hypothetical protein A2Y78_08550 [Acidobacteria bacterium RBG_13_68_16]
MGETSLDRKELFTSAGKLGMATCLCALGATRLLAEQSPETAPGAATPARAVKRMEFSDLWVRRFMNVLDGTLDEETRKKVMVANGTACFREWIASRGRTIAPVAFEAWAAKVKERPPDDSLRVEGNVIYWEYTGSAETGGASPEGVCLCPMVESKPAGLSRTFCHCSVGYVKELYEQRFARLVKVELLDSVLYGGKRCRFKITVA